MSVVSQRLRRTFEVGGLVTGTGVLLLALSAERAQSDPVEPVVRVEEDWVLVLNEPDGNVDAPQYHTVMSPFADFDENYGQVLWNYRETPDFHPGGVQMQGYFGDSLVTTRSLEFDKLDTNAETITWTQSLETDGDTLSFEVKDGSSSTWGTFGKDMRLDSDAELPSLAAYSTDFSVQNSGPTYGSNRVDVMMITQVRRYGAGGNLLSVDATPKVVFQLED